ncbi:hypothetical protein [Parasphingorhabdus marina]|nr:hypothetical protein [Parasphingorhabdus marina]
MNTTSKMTVLENILERAATQLGDVTEPVMAQYYSDHPNAQQSFREHGLGNTRKLEAEMVESVLYCIMNWLERPQEIRIMFGSTVPHHEDTLRVSSDWFTGLVDAGIAVIDETIPASENEERQVLQEIHAGLTSVVKEARI